MQQPEIPLPTINTRSFSQTEDSRPAQRISAGAPRPSPLKPHGLKSELKSAASAFKGIFKQKKPEGVTVVAFNKMNASIPEPVKSQTPAEIKEFVFSVTPTESIPPEFNLEELSPRYKKHLSRKYTYSSVFTKPSDTIQRVYQEPDLDTFSYSEPTNPIPSVYDPEDASQYPPSEYSSDFQYPDASEFEQDDAGNLEQDQENVYVERFEGAHGLNSADTESYHTIHRLNMLPLVDDSNTASQPVVRRMSTGHLNLLETYSEIIGEISELVPGTPTMPTTRRIRSSVANLEDLIAQMKLTEEEKKKHGLIPRDSSYSILSAYQSTEQDEDEDHLPSEVVVEEYFVEHWVRAPHSDSESNGATPSPSSEPSPTSPPLLVASDSDATLTPPSAFHDESDSDSDPEAKEHLIVSRVTRIVTLSRNKVVKNVEVTVHPLGKVEAPAPEKLLARASQRNLRALEKEQAAAKEVLKEEKGEAGVVAKKEVKEKRRSGLSQFLHLLTNL